jgi:hypothetical protein
MGTGHGLLSRVSKEESKEEKEEGQDSRFLNLFSNSFSDFAIVRIGRSATR